MAAEAADLTEVHQHVDLDQRGMLGDTAIVWMGEFGRTPRINGGAGRDHWARAWSVVLGGAGMRGPGMDVEHQVGFGGEGGGRLVGDGEARPAPAAGFGHHGHQVW